jgi:hypothetical protein
VPSNELCVRRLLTIPLAIALLAAPASAASTDAPMRASGG